jgi:membrane-associated HD superfamily phosphohydrolase
MAVDAVTLIGTASLALQIVVLLLLIVGYNYKRRMKFKQHGTILGLAVILHLVMIFAIMIPSFYFLIPAFLIPSAVLNTLVVLIHAVSGTAAIIMGVYLIGVWGFRKDMKSCFRRKVPMRYTFIVWIVSLIFGILLYGIFYGPLLFS